MLHFTISFPTDEGYFGRECNNRQCGRYFRVHSEDLQERMFCPYCGVQFHKDQFFTRSQLAFAHRVAEEKALKYAHDEIDRMLRRTFGRSSGSGLLKWEIKTKRYRERPVHPDYQEQKVDTALTCHQCGVRFQVDGIFGYCPKCGVEHLRIYDANLVIIRQEVETASNPERALRHAYSDLVSTFELLCKRRAVKLTGERGRFQNLAATKQFFLTHGGADVFDLLAAAEFLTLRRVFQKRHIYAHGSATIDDRYIREVPEDAALYGTAPTLSMSEFDAAATAIRKVLDRIVLLTR